MKIENLIPGQRFYDVDNNRITTFEYIGPFPSPPTNPTYVYNEYIILNRDMSDPLRVHETHLQRILDKGLTNRLKAHEYMVSQIKEALEYYESKVERDRLKVKDKVYDMYDELIEDMDIVNLDLPTGSYKLQTFVNSIGNLYVMLPDGTQVFLDLIDSINIRKQHYEKT